MSASHEIQEGHWIGREPNAPWLSIFEIQSTWYAVAGCVHACGTLPEPKQAVPLVLREIHDCQWTVGSVVVVSWYGHDWWRRAQWPRRVQSLTLQ